MTNNGAPVDVVPLTLVSRCDEPAPAYPADVEERLRADAATIIARYPRPRSALLPLLHMVQAEDGYTSPAGIGFCARLLQLTDTEVAAVATFYSMYRRTPTGSHLVGVCTNTLCAVMGGDAVLETLERHLGVSCGETTADDAITLERVECNAACDFAPVVMVNWQFHDNQTPGKAIELVDSLRTGDPRPPTRGAGPCTFRQAARLLAGLIAEEG